MSSLEYSYTHTHHPPSFKNTFKNIAKGMVLALSLSLPFQQLALAQHGSSQRKSTTRNLHKTSQKSDPHKSQNKDVGNFTLLQKGMASWYSTGRKSHHLRTAQGSRFHPEELTAAHPFLPFGTKLLIRSQRTGKSVIVKVNDRGPYAKNRIIDLSRSAAERIGLVKSGIGAVTVSILAKNAPLKKNSDNDKEAVLAANEVAQMPNDESFQPQSAQ